MSLKQERVDPYETPLTDARLVAAEDAGAGAPVRGVVKEFPGVRVTGRRAGFVTVVAGVMLGMGVNGFMDSAIFGIVLFQVLAVWVASVVMFLISCMRRIKMVG
ncbi:MAG: hypothetical protein ACSHX6_05395 [Akkermansiaceae bacterium]